MGLARQMNPVADTQANGAEGERGPEPESEAEAFYGKVLNAADRLALGQARVLRGVAEEIAVLRLELRRILAEQPGDMEAIRQGMGILLRALEMQQRIAPGGELDIARLASIFEGLDVRASDFE
jgi:hypothetical protein